MNNDIVKGFDEAKEESLKIRLEKIGQIPGCLVLHLTGYIDAYNHNYFQKKVAMVVDAGFIRLVLDMRGINFIGSTGVGGLVALMNSLRQKTGDVVLQEMQPRVYEVFQLLGFHQYFAICDNLEESIAWFARKPAPAPFMRKFACPICEVRLRASRAGRFRCSHCRTIITLAETGAVALG